MPTLRATESVHLAVVSAHVERGSCMGGLQAFDRECHILVVRLALDAGAPVPVLAAGTWSATPTSLHASGDQSGFVSPGASANITVRLEYPQGSGPIQRLRYDAVTAFGQVSVPPYASAPRDEELVQVEVLGVTVEPHRCFSDMHTSHECHRLRVRIASNATSDLDVGPLSWSATDVDGGVYTDAHVAGPAKVAPGGEAVVTVGFDLEPGALSLASLRLDDSWLSIAVRATVPAY